jgi:hypothetical protein
VAVPETERAWLDVARGKRANPIPARARQTIPPALRRAVLHRDHGCCRAPGGGRHPLENIITLCGVLDTHAKVFSALRGLGFREAEARAAFAELRKQPHLIEASAQELLRAALQLLTAPRARPAVASPARPRLSPGNAPPQRHLARQLGFA